MNLIRPRASHWYAYKAGEITPAYECPNASKPGEMRATTLRDAKKERLYPSVTNILSVLNKPALNDWRVTQGILAALTLPRLEGESLDAFAQRVVDDMDIESGKARDFGTAIHDALDVRLKTRGIPQDEDPALIPYLADAWYWLKKNVPKVSQTEYYAACTTNCFAGRIDIRCEFEGRLALIDFKTQKVRKGKATFYDEWPLQLAAYAKADCLPSAELISLVIDSAAPGPCHVKVWPFTERGYYWRMFEHCLDLWCMAKGYDPRTWSDPQ